MSRHLKINITIKERNTHMTTREDATAQKYYKNGTLYRESIVVGDEEYYTRYNESGAKVATGCLKGGKRHGTRTIYHANGAAEVISHYKDGVLDGEYKYTDRFGNLILHGNFSNGERSGEWIECDKQGNVENKRLYAQKASSNSAATEVSARDLAAMAAARLERLTRYRAQ